MPLEDIVSALARAPLFRDVAPEQLRMLAFSAQTRDLNEGETLMTQGDAYAPAALVLAGDLKVDTGAGPAGDAGPGSLLNAEGALAGQPAPVTLKAVKGTRVLLIERELVARLISEYPAMGRAMLRSLGSDLRGLARSVRTAGAAALEKTSAKD